MEFTSDKLNECANFFITGSTPQIIGGVVILAITIVTSFSKLSIPSIVRMVAEGLLKSKVSK